MDKKTLLIFLAMYAYGFTLMIWAIFFHKQRTKTTITAAAIGLAVLIATVFYTVYVLWAIGITD